MEEQSGREAGSEGDPLGPMADIVHFGETPDGSKDGETVGESVKDFEQRVRKELKEATQMAKLAGNAPNWMDNAIKNADHVRVPWHEVLVEYMKALSIADYSWSRFNRREFIKTGVLAPDMWQPAMGGVRVYIDASGSCWDALPKFNKHLKDVWEQTKPKWVEVRYFQTEVNHEYDQRFERGEGEIDVREVGGGGTNFSWLADDLADCEERPEVCLFLTDLEGGFGREPEDIPVIWVCVTEHTQVPFGEVINVN